MGLAPDFSQAIAIDRGYALAYSGLADTYAALPSYTRLPSEALHRFVYSSSNDLSNTTRRLLDFACLADLLLFRTVHTRAEFRGDVARNLLLQRDDVCALAAIVLPPDFGVVPNIYQFRTHVDIVSVRRHSSGY